MGEVVVYFGGGSAGRQEQDPVGPRVCMISGSYPPIRDGVGHYTRVFFHELTRQLGADRVCLVTTAVGQPVEVAPNLFYRVPRWTLSDLGPLLEVVEGWSPDVISVQYPTNGYGRRMGATFMTSFLRARLPHVPIVATLHEFSNRKLKGRCRLIASLLPCDRILAASRGYERDIAALWPALRARISYLPVGSNVTARAVAGGEREALAARLGVAECRPILLHFGVIRAGKGIEPLLDAFELVRRQLPSARLLLVGRADERFLEGTVKPRLAEGALDEAVVVTGQLTDPELSACFGLADVCVLPFPDGVSTKRGSFMAALEHRQAVVTTSPRIAFPELADGENVVLCEPGDAGALADTVIRVLTDDPLRERIKAGVGALRAHFTWDRIVAAAVEVFQEARCRRLHVERL